MPESLSKIAAAGRIGPEDVMAIRRAIYHPDGHVGADEAEWLFALDTAVRERDRSWEVLFVEALTDYTVHQMQPDGYVSEANAQWLMARIGHDGHVETRSELELLVNILEEATSCPNSLASFALGEIKASVLSEVRVSAANAVLLRRALYAMGGQQNIAITRAEAEVLFDIHDAVANAANDPAWDDLFVKAIANHMMFASGYQVPAREEALRRDAWLDDANTNVGGFFARMASGLSDVFRLYSAPGAQSAQDRSRHIDEAIAERVTEDEARWLAARILKNGVVDGPEAALLAFIRAESPEIHPALKAALDKAA
ncbi:hypothetical protein [Aestuariivirga sp.]|uniref:hypothetical protein n=1 Tax=Aestuariivirga sp. TaxID=2650926 RepID=UPI0035938842